MPSWKVRFNVPRYPTLSSPLEIVIEQAPADRPAEVIVEVWESDARKYEVDDYADKAPRGSSPTEGDDLLVVFAGTLANHPSRPKGVVFNRTSTTPQFKDEQGTDHVGLRFEDEPASAVTQVVIPPSGYEPVEGTGDGQFYELFFLIRDKAAAPDADPLVISKVQVVRRRTDLLLAIEPLAQGSSQMNSPMGKMILDYFHDGDTSTKQRSWGSTIVAMRDGLPMFQQESGCSFASLTMILRYLRVRADDTSAPPASVSWETLYDRTAGGPLLEQHRPLTTKATLSKYKYDKFESATGFQPIPDASKIEELAEQIRKNDPLLDKKKVKGRKTPRAKSPETWANAAPADGNKEAAEYFKNSSPDPHHWVARVIWWFRQQIGATSHVSLQRGQMRWQRHLEDGTTEITPMLDGAAPIYKYRFTPEPCPDDWSVESWKPVPLASSLRKALGVTSDYINLSSNSSADWSKRLKAHLASGLPAIAHFKSGQYQKDDGGHYTVVVGYRSVNGGLYYIINDPAGAKSLQYQVLLEQDFSPTVANRYEPKSLDLEVFLDTTKKAAPLDAASWDENALAAKDLRQLDLSLPDGRTVKLTIRYQSAIASGGSATNLGGVRVTVEEDGSGAQLLDVSVVGKNKKLTYRHSGSGETFTLSTGEELTIRANGAMTRKDGERFPQPWEGKWNVMVEQRKQMSLYALYLIGTTEPWERGAARFVQFDGRSIEDNGEG